MPISLTSSTAGWTEPVQQVPVGLKIYLSWSRPGPWRPRHVTCGLRRCQGRLRDSFASIRLLHVPPHHKLVLALCRQNDVVADHKLPNSQALV